MAGLLMPPATPEEELLPTRPSLFGYMRNQQYDPRLDPVSADQVPAWQQAQKTYTPGDWKSQFVNDLANLFPRPGATEDQNIYRSLQAGLGIMGSRGMGGTPAGVLSMNVYHGSPHKFDKFDMSKVGTGEGAQAYGHGLYFAQNPKTAKAYADQVLDMAKIDAANKRMVELARVMDQDAIPGRYRQFKSEAGRAAAKEYDRLMESKMEPGALYKVDLPDDQIAKMLDWDKPMSQQPGGKRVIDAYKELERARFGGRVNRDMSNATGKEIYEAVSSAEPSPAYASAWFKQLGIPGIRYLDQGSRAGGKGTSNFVVFDDQIPKIIGRE